MEIEQLYTLFKESTGISTDSRAIEKGSIFFALKGESFDGNTFALKALESGASYAVVDDKTLPENKRYIQVENVLNTLQKLANKHRRELGIPIVGLTGTNGKTTTKELITAVLQTEYKTASTQGNFNNHIGVPLTLLKMDSKTQIGVVEMGASSPGEIAALVAISEPDYGLVTNVGKAHLLGFGSFDGVKKTKGELYDFIKTNDGAILYNIDNPDLCEMVNEREPVRSIPYGISYQEAAVLLTSSEHPYLRIRLKGGELIETRLIGSYNADNVMAALAVGELFFTDLKASIEAISNYTPSNNRSQLVKGKSNTLIIDAYNANPTSMRAALGNFATMEKGASSLIIGDMLELGSESQNEHKAILSIIEEMDAGKLFFVGDEFSQASLDFPKIREKAMFFKNSTDLRNYLETNPVTGYTFLVKGSRGTKLEKVLDLL